MSKPEFSAIKLFRAFLVGALLAAIIYLIVQHIGTFGNVLLVLLGLGVVVLVHEFGHFVFAKLSGIKVEAFSIGFPPTLLGIQMTEQGCRIRVLPGFFSVKKEDDKEEDKKDNDNEEDDKDEKTDAPRAPGGDTGAESDQGRLSFTIGGEGRAWDTEYCIGLIPVGGYVKMLGQEDTGSAKSSDDPRSFANKPVGARAVVISAGVVFNVIAAVIIFMIVFLIGINRPPALVGAVEPNSPSVRAGLEAGDEIIEIDGKSNNLDFTDIMLAAALSGRGEEVSLKVQRDGAEIDKPFTLVAEKKNDRPLKPFGIIMPQTVTVAELKEQAAVKDLLARTGLAPGDVIKSVDDKEVKTHWEMMSIAERVLTPTVKLEAERTGEAEPVKGEIELGWMFAEDYKIKSESELYHIHSMVPRLRVTAYTGMPEPESLPIRAGKKIKALVVWVARKIGSLFGIEVKKKSGPAPPLQPGDIILAIGDVNNPTYTEMREVVQANKDKEISITVLRADPNGVEEHITVSIVPRSLPDSDWVQIGAALELDARDAVVAKIIEPEEGPPRLEKLRGAMITAVDGEPVKTIQPEEGPPRLEKLRGAMITAVDGEPVSSFYDVVREIKDVVDEIKKYPGEHITIEYRRDDETAGAFTLNVRTDDKAITVKSGFAEFVPLKPLKRLYKASGPVDAVVMGGRKTVTLIAQTYLTLKCLVSGLVSPKELMGPVGILAVSYQTVVEKMWIEYLFLIGLINAAIAVFNFLPLPPLDGGLAVLLVVEKVKGSAVSERTQGFLIRAGLVLVLALFLYITLNDVIRNFFS